MGTSATGSRGITGTYTVCPSRNRSPGSVTRAVAGEATRSRTGSNRSESGSSAVIVASASSPSTEIGAVPPTAGGSGGGDPGGASGAGSPGLRSTGISATSSLASAISTSASPGRTGWPRTA